LYNVAVIGAYIKKDAYSQQTQLQIFDMFVDEVVDATDKVHIRKKSIPGEYEQYAGKKTLQSLLVLFLLWLRNFTRIILSASTEDTADLVAMFKYCTAKSV
jgi:hypothetical protein